VKAAEERRCELSELPLEILSAIDGRIDARVFDVLSVDASVRSRTSYGGTAPERVREQVAAARERLALEDPGTSR
jgi:argininosuccinate lyase